MRFERIEIWLGDSLDSLDGFSVSESSGCDFNCSFLEPFSLTSSFMSFVSFLSLVSFGSSSFFVSFLF